MDDDRLVRFEREAQILASLNHPNIAAIYGVEDATGVPALVMELVEGPTLADRIGMGPIPIDEGVADRQADRRSARSRARAGSHSPRPEAGNIKVRPDGAVKVLDFGLAKAFDPAAWHSGSAMNSPTVSTHATRAGIILGTAAYMAPEQARGKAVDRRVDIWAFGVVLYEMLSGTRLGIRHPFSNGVGQRVPDHQHGARNGGSALIADDHCEHRALRLRERHTRLDAPAHDRRGRDAPQRS